MDVADNSAKIAVNVNDIDNHKHDPEGKYFCFVGEVYIFFFSFCNEQN